MEIRRLIVGAAIAVPLFAQVATEANSGYRTPEARARVAANLTGEERDARQQPVELIASLGIRTGSTVVDLGTGAGYMLPYLSRAVGASGTVIAEDIFRDFLDRARNTARDAGLINVTFLLGTDTDPRLPVGAADLVLVLDAYHHFDYPSKMLAAIRAGLRSGGRLAIVEYHKKVGAMAGDPRRALTHIRVSEDEVVREVEAAGFTLISKKDHLPNRQYIAIFARGQ